MANATLTTRNTTQNDKARRIQNVAVVENRSTATNPNYRDVSSRFREDASLARELDPATRFSKAQQVAEEEARFEYQKLMERLEEMRQAESNDGETIRQNIERQAVAKLKKQAIQKAAKKAVAKKTLSFMSKWGPATIAWNAYIWFTVFCALLSAIGFAGEAFIQESASFLISIVSFLGWEISTPFYWVALGCWGIVVLVTLVEFLLFSLWYTITGTSMTEGIRLPMVGVFFLLSITPFINILPWTPLWVMYMSMDGLFSFSRKTLAAH